MKTTRELYYQYLLSTQVNYTSTNLADHFADLSHDDVYRYVKQQKLTPRLLWEKVKPLLTSRLPELWFRLPELRWWGFFIGITLLVSYRYYSPINRLEIPGDVNRVFCLLNSPIQPTGLAPDGVRGEWLG